LLSSFSPTIDLSFCRTRRFCRKKPETMGLEKELENERMDYEEEFKTGEPKSS
jgi:hypothetical protein